jgi:hypothetical protein
MYDIINDNPIFFLKVSCQQQNFLVDIKGVKGPTLAFLPVLAFEGGTRRNIPSLSCTIVTVKGEKGINSNTFFSC